MLKQRYDDEIPEMTVEVARAAFPKGNVVIKVRDELGVLFSQDEFRALYPTLGQPAFNPATLAMVTVLQFMENLTDREAAEAVRSRIDWKYALGLELSDAGFDQSVLSEFRQRILAGGQEGILLEKVLKRCEERGLLAGKRKQRTDSTHILANIRTMNRTELSAEALRRALDAVAAAAPEWLRSVMLPEWGQRYGRKIESSRLSAAKWTELVKQVGADGYYLLEAVQQASAPTNLKTLPAVTVLRQIWIQQFYRENGETVWREKKQHGIPPASTMIASPDEPDARYACKGNTTWTGYKVHLTETCADDAPHLITHVETTPGPVLDLTMTEKIEQALAAAARAPETHWCDGGYIDVEVMVKAQQNGIDLVGPVHQDSSWQAHAQTGYDLSHFSIDWERMTATCPQGQTSSHCKQRINLYGKSDFRFGFDPQTCHVCTARQQCTRSEKYGRQLTVYPQLFHETLLNARHRQQTDVFKTLYNKRAGIEGTISQAIRKCQIRYARYRGLTKTHLQHLATAAAINLQRVAAWLMGERPEKTRSSTFAALVVPL